MNQSTCILDEGFVIFDGFTGFPFWIIARVNLGFRHVKSNSNDDHSRIPNVIIVSVANK